jgi:hypothetical protein
MNEEGGIRHAKDNSQGTGKPDSRSNWQHARAWASTLARALI